MAQARQTRSWWTGTVAQWRRSGLTAAQFAVREGLSVSSLRWWSSALGRGSRASEHGGRAPAIQAIDLAVPSGALRASDRVVEVAVGNVVTRNMRAVAHAVAQQELKGLTVPAATTRDLLRVARGEISVTEAIGNVYARLGNVPVFQP